MNFLPQTFNSKKKEGTRLILIPSIYVGLLGLPSAIAQDKLLAQTFNSKKKEGTRLILIPSIYVGLLGLEPRLFWTKTRRVASYTIDQCVNAGANLKHSFGSANIFIKKFDLIQILKI